MSERKSSLDPFATSSETRAFGYNSILLPWETGTVQLRTDRFDRLAIRATLALEIKSIKLLDDIAITAEQPWPSEEFLNLHVYGKTTWEAIFKRLRDTFAHGHFGTEKRGWITFDHRFKGRGEPVARPRLFGRMQVGTLQKLVATLQQP